MELRGENGKRLVRVAGASMLPTLRPGDLVVVDPDRVPRLGEIAVFRCGDILVIHRVISGVGDGRRGRQMGDNTWRADRFRPEDVRGSVIAVHRDGALLDLPGRGTHAFAVTLRSLTRLARARIRRRIPSSKVQNQSIKGATSMTTEQHEVDGTEAEASTYVAPTLTHIGSLEDAVAFDGSGGDA